MTKSKSGSASGGESGPITLKPHAVSGLAQAREEIRRIGACEASVDIMAPKLIFLTYKIENLPCPAANILKQEALSLGAEAVVSQWAVNCSKPTTDVVLGGTVAQMRRLSVKLKMQGYGLPPEPARKYFDLSRMLSKHLAGLKDSSAGD